MPADIPPIRFARARGVRLAYQDPPSAASEGGPMCGPAAACRGADTAPGNTVAPTAAAAAEAEGGPPEVDGRLPHIVDAVYAELIVTAELCAARGF